MVRSSTQKVMPSGTQTSRPVIRYFFMRLCLYASGRAAGHWAGVGAGAGRHAGGLGFFGLAAVLEVGSVIAAAFQLKTCGSQLFDESILAAFRTNGERRIAHFLQYVFLQAATGTSISINRHNFLLPGNFQRRALYIRGRHFRAPSQCELHLCSLRTDRKRMGGLFT